MPRLLCMVKLLDQLRWRHRSLKLPSLLKTLAPPHLSRQGILYCLLVGIVVGVAKEIEAESFFAVIVGNETCDKVFSESLVNIMSRDSEDTVVHNFPSGSVEVSRYTLTGIRGEDEDFDLAFWRFREIISGGEKRSKMRNCSVAVHTTVAVDGPQRQHLQEAGQGEEQGMDCGP